MLLVGDRCLAADSLIFGASINHRLGELLRRLAGSVVLRGRFLLRVAHLPHSHSGESCHSPTITSQTMVRGMNTFQPSRMI